MTDHTHTVITPGCYRCELNADEMEAIADDCRVTGKGVVHDPDCHYVSAPTSHAVHWVKAERLSTDRPCSRCLPAGAETPPTA